MFLPFVQKQWLNLSLFNINDISFYTYLYYFSGLICPIFLCLNSLNFFIYYNFNNLNHREDNLVITGRALLCTVLIVLFIFINIITSYFFITFDFINKIFIDKSYIFNLDISKFLFVSITIGLLLLFKKTKVFLKKILLFNYFIISLFIWYSSFKEIEFNNNYLIYNSISKDNVFYLNIIYLFLIEFFYYIWTVLMMCACWREVL